MFFFPSPPEFLLKSIEEHIARQSSDYVTREKAEVNYDHQESLNTNALEYLTGKRFCNEAVNKRVVRC